MLLQRSGFSFLPVALLAFAVPVSALASTPPAAAVKLETSREGDLPEKVRAHFLLKGPGSLCDKGFSIEKIKVTKVASGSAHETKVPGTATVYDAIYLVQRLCFFGTTFVGAYRDGSQAVFIKASRRGVENSQAVIQPSQPDLIEILENVTIPELY